MKTGRNEGTGEPGGKGRGNRQGGEMRKRKDWAMHVWVRPGELKDERAQVIQEPRVETTYHDEQCGAGAHHGLGCNRRLGSPARPVPECPDGGRGGQLSLGGRTHVVQ